MRTQIFRGKASYWFQHRIRKFNDILKSKLSTFWEQFVQKCTIENVLKMGVNIIRIVRVRAINSHNAFWPFFMAIAKNKKNFIHCNFKRGKFCFIWKSKFCASLNKCKMSRNPYIFACVMFLANYEPKMFTISCSSKRERI